MLRAEGVEEHGRHVGAIDEVADLVDRHDVMGKAASARSDAQSAGSVSTQSLSRLLCDVREKRPHGWTESSHGLGDV